MMPGQEKSHQSSSTNNHQHILPSHFDLLDSQSILSSPSNILSRRKKGLHLLSDSVPASILDIRTRLILEYVIDTPHLCLNKSNQAPTLHWKDHSPISSARARTRHSNSRTGISQSSPGPPRPDPFDVNPVATRSNLTAISNIKKLLPWNELSILSESYFRARILLNFFHVWPPSPPRNSGWPPENYF